MAWIRTVSQDEATGPLEELYQIELDALGFVLEATRAVAVRPEIAVAKQNLERVLLASPALSKREYRLIQLVVAQRIRSTACVFVYAGALEGALGGLEGVGAVLRDYRAAGLSEREVAILDYAVATAVGHPTEAHVTRLRQVGLDDGGIVDVAATAAYRLFGSRIYDALGVEADPFFRDQADLVELLTATGAVDLERRERDAEAQHERRADPAA